MRGATSRVTPRELRALRAENGRLRRENATLRSENKKLKGLLEAVRREAKRQAAPFSRNKPKRHPKKSGRKSGSAYGRRGERPIPDRVDETHDSPLPPVSPCCHAPIEETHVEPLFLEDLPEWVRTWITKFLVHVGRCTRCRRQVRGRHPKQTSTALYAAGNQIGPRALALAVHMNKELGVPHGRIVKFFAATFRLTISKAAIVRGVERIARRAEPLYQQITLIVRASAIVYPDETGWRISARLAWLWDFVCDAATLYVIRESRGFDVIEEVLGAEWTGILGCDGWAPYRNLEGALLQACNAHLFRRSGEMDEAATRGAVRFPRAVAGLRVRDRRDRGEISPHGLAVARGRLQERLRRLLHESRLTNAENRRFAKHLRNYEDDILRYLEVPGLQATNWPAEQELRPAVVTRKISAGNRTPRGAHTQAVLASVLRTAARQQRDPLDLLVRVQRANSEKDMPWFSTTLKTIGGAHAPPDR